MPKKMTTDDLANEMLRRCRSEILVLLEPYKALAKQLRDHQSRVHEVENAIRRDVSWLDGHLLEVEQAQTRVERAITDAAEKAKSW